jgi:hypothetical protein
MGYPFDRLPPQSSDSNNTIESFVTPNMAYSNVLITHKNVYFNKKEGTLKKGINHATYPIGKPRSMPTGSSFLGFTKEKKPARHLFKVNGVKYMFSYSPMDNVHYVVRVLR